MGASEQTCHLLYLVDTAQGFLDIYALRSTVPPLLYCFHKFHYLTEADVLSSLGVRNILSLPQEPFEYLGIS